MKTIIEIHALQNFAPSNLNRDDTGAPKDAFFGGTRRARISSQCFKRAIRNKFPDLLDMEDLGTRTKLISDAIVSKLVQENNRSAEEAEEKVRKALESIKIVIKNDGKSEYLLFLGQREISELCRIIDEKWDSINISKSEKKSSSKKEAEKTVDPDLKKALEKVFDGGKAVDVALFGRMLADMPEKNQYAACQVAHAISTHAVEREFDYYTALDDLKPDESPGADMIGTIEFNSACFYRYAVVDWEKFLENLQKDQELAKKGLQAFLKSFVIAEPTGKQNSFAAHNLPEFVAVSIRKNSAPRNLANAFEIAIRPRRGESITAKSVEAIFNKAQILQGAFGGDETAYFLNLTDAKTSGFGGKVDSLEELLLKTLEELKE